MNPSPFMENMMLDWLKSPIAHHRQEAVHFLWSNTKPHVVAAVMNAYLTDTDENVRVNAIRAFRFVPDNPRVVDLLLTVLQDTHASELIRSCAVEALAALRVPEAAAPLIAIVTDDREDKKLHESIAVYFGTFAELLAERADSQAIGLLIAALAAANETASKAYFALRRIGATAVPDLIAALSHPDATVRWRAASLLGDMADLRALDALQIVVAIDTAVIPGKGAVREGAERAMHRIVAKAGETPAEGSETAPAFDWAGLLRDWSIALIEAGDLPEPPTQDAIDSQWLGYPGATEAHIVAAEARLGTRFPPSYREFLAVSNGWGKLTHSIDKLWSTADVGWFRDLDPVSATIWGEPNIGDDEYNTDVANIAVLLQISDRGDAAYFLLNPNVVTDDGEWEAWFLASWLPGWEKYPSFWALMNASYTGMIS